MSGIVQFQNGKPRTCACCGSAGVRMTFEPEQFNYKSEDDQIAELSVQIPVWTCPTCNEQYTDERAEDIRHEAVCHYLGRLTPSEIRHLRESSILSQSQWADLTGIGVASVKRWETGFLIQGAAMDRYLRLLRDQRNITALRRMPGEVRDTGRPHFRTQLPAVATEHAAAFELRPTRSAA